MSYNLSAVGGEAFYDTDNIDGLVKSQIRLLHNRENQQIMAFPPSVARLFRTPTMLTTNSRLNLWWSEQGETICRVFFLQRYC